MGLPTHCACLSLSRLTGLWTFYKTSGPVRRTKPDGNHLTMYLPYQRIHSMKGCKSRMLSVCCALTSDRHTKSYVWLVYQGEVNPIYCPTQCLHAFLDFRRRNAPMYDISHVWSGDVTGRKRGHHSTALIWGFCDLYKSVLGRIKALM
jgi:hypothetical protein